MTTWLIDKSALARLDLSPDADLWVDRMGRAVVHVSTVTRLEVGYSAQSAADFAALRFEPPLGPLPVAYLTPQIEDRAVDVQQMLAEAGHHRAPSVADLLLAATAELEGHVVLHLDKDFDLIAAVTGQAVERLAS